MDEQLKTEIREWVQTCVADMLEAGQDKRKMLLEFATWLESRAQLSDVHSLEHLVDDFIYLNRGFAKIDLSQ